jgi:hypothetical protein
LVFVFVPAGKLDGDELYREAAVSRTYRLDTVVSSSQQKVVQYLSEAHANENALVRVLQSQIAMTPDGSANRRWRRT